MDGLPFGITAAADVFKALELTVDTIVLLKKVIDNVHCHERDYAYCFAVSLTKVEMISRQQLTKAQFETSFKQINYPS
jgi:hypothetical protein